MVNNKEEIVQYGVVNEPRIGAFEGMVTSEYRPFLKTYFKKPSGYGRYILKNNEIQEGYFPFHKMTGPYCRVISKTGEVYTGEMKNGFKREKISPILNSK